MTAKHLNRAELADPPRTLPANLGSLARHRLRGLLPQTSDLVAHLKTREATGSNSIKQGGDRVNCQVQLQWLVWQRNKTKLLIEPSSPVI